MLCLISHRKICFFKFYRNARDLAGLFVYMYLTTRNQFLIIFVTMKKKYQILLLFALGIALQLVFGCQKHSSAPEQRTSTPAVTSCTMPSGITNIQWKPVLTGYIDFRFDSTGTYYESNFNNQGTWSFKCNDTIKIQKPSYYVFYRIVSVTNDTLKLRDILNTVYCYHK